MRIVLFDGIQEAHVAESLARALTAAGHEVHHTGRFGAGYVFRDTEELLPVVAPHLARIADFRPDVVLVFRPASAPYPVLQALRATGAVLVTWFSDDPVLFGHSYGPAVDLYDLVLHCGGAAVLRFYEERFGRPTGVNLPFWTDHVAFPAVHGLREPDTDVLFLGNMVGPVRRWRYAQLAAMRHRVRVFGQVGEDPAGLGAGFLDAEAEVVRAGARSRLALNIPQLFRDHRGQPTWFPGLDALGWFELPSRVIQYAAMGLPTLSVIPGGAPSPAFPELPVADTVEEADRWIGDVLDSGRLAELSEQVRERFDRSYSAAARVLALESLLADDGWRALDPEERATWFLQFDGRTAPAAVDPAAERLPVAPPARPRRERVAAAGAAPAPDVVVVHAGEPRRFGPLDVVLRELATSGRLAGPTGPSPLRRVEALPGRDGAPAEPFTHLLDADALLASRAGEPTGVVVLAQGVGLDPAGAETLRAAGVAAMCLLTDERMDPRVAARFDLVVQVGPAPVDHVALLRGLPNAVVCPGLVESALVAALEGMPTQDGALLVRSGSADATAVSLLDAVDGPRAQTAASELAELGARELAALLRREVLCLVPEGEGRTQAHPPLTPAALCAAEQVLTARHRRFREEDLWGSWLVKAATPAEAALKLARAAQDRAEPGRRSPLGAAAALGPADHRRRFDARPRIAAWIAQAQATARERPASAELLLDDGADVSLPLDRRVTVDAGLREGTAREALLLRLALADTGAVEGLRVWDGDVLLAEAAAPPGMTDAVDVVVTGLPLTGPGPLCLELVGARGHRMRRHLRVRTRVRAVRVPRRADAPPPAGAGATILPACASAFPPTTSSETESES